MISKTDTSSLISSSIRRTKYNDNFLWPFATGVASASIFWFLAFLIRQRRLKEHGYERAHRWPWERIGRHRPLSFTRKSFNLNFTFKSFFQDNDDSGVCIGSIFGLDVGGTLAKLVYFDVNACPSSSLSRANSQANTASSHSTNSTSSLHRSSSLASLNPSNANNDYSPGIEMKKCLSMFDLTKSHEHAKALESFYSFANHLDHFGETGFKDTQLSFYSEELKGEFHFIQFETRMMSSAMDLIKATNIHANIVEMGATGGGAHKYADMWEQTLGITMKKTEELESLVAGMQFVLADRQLVAESYTFKPSLSYLTNINHNDQEFTQEYENWSQKVQVDRHLSSYPYLVVIIGTGVSILRVDGPKKYERISGSTIGGGTFLGLCRLLTDAIDYEDVMNLAEKGDPFKVDMTVGDIYGQNSDALEKLGLPAWLVASSFGKLVTKRDPAEGITQDDLARALLIMVTNNIGQVAYLNAQIHNTSRLYFVGNFLRHNNISQRRLAYAINYWSKGKMEALFLEHEGYFGALGAFLLSQRRSTEDKQTGNESLRSSLMTDSLVSSFRDKSDVSRSFSIRTGIHKRKNNTKSLRRFQRGGV